MGLDMYLKGKRYLSSTFNEGDDTKAAAIAEMFPELAGMRGQWGGSAINEVAIDAGYWRKANAIHKWFVDNCQGGEDDCGYHYVGRYQLEELRSICQRVLDFKHLANELLPTASGFFFGGTEFDEYYFQDIEQTIKIIDTSLALPNSWDFEYHSSW